MASEASQENFEKIVFLTTKYVQIVKLEHLLCPKVGGGTNPLVPPTFESGEARAPPPLPPPFSYALEYIIVRCICFKRVGCTIHNFPFHFPFKKGGVFSVSGQSLSEMEFWVYEKKNGRDLTQSYDKILYNHRKNPKSNVTTQKRHQQLQLHNDKDGQLKKRQA